MYVCMYECMCVCMYVYIYIYIYKIELYNIFNYLLDKNIKLKIYFYIINVKMCLF